MTVDEVMAELESLGNEKMRAMAHRNGAGDAQFGVLKGTLRKVAKRIGRNAELADELWATGNVDAQLLAILLLRPSDKTIEELGEMARTSAWSQVSDWLNAYLIRKHKQHETLREAWMDDSSEMVQRSGWDLTAERVVKSPDGLDLTKLMDRLEAGMRDAHPDAQWTMNTTLAMIGIEHAEHRDRALAIGESLGVFAEWPEVAGCTSPYVPIWVNEMVSRQTA